MKIMGSLTAKLLSCGVVFLAIGLVSDIQAKEGKAVIRAIRGSAQIMSSKDGTWKRMKVGQTLKEGVIIKTGTDSHVDLFLDRNGPVLRVTPETEIGLDRLTYEETGTDTVINTALNLKKGRILGHVKKLTADSRYEIKMPTGVAGVRRGADFNIKVAVVEGNAGKTSSQFTISSLNGTLVAVRTSRAGDDASAVINTGETWNPEIYYDVQPLTPTVLQATRAALAEAMTSATGNIFIVNPNTGQITDTGKSVEKEDAPIAIGIPEDKPDDNKANNNGNTYVPPTTGDSTPTP